MAVKNDSFKKLALDLTAVLIEKLANMNADTISRYTLLVLCCKWPVVGQ